MKHQHDLSCKDILDNLNAYIDGELDARLCKEIEAHIKTCQNCHIVVNTTNKTIHLFREDAQEVTLPEDVRLRLLAKLDLENDARK